MVANAGRRQSANQAGQSFGEALLGFFRKPSPHRMGGSDQQVTNWIKGILNGSVNGVRNGISNGSTKMLGAANVMVMQVVSEKLASSSISG